MTTRKKQGLALFVMALLLAWGGAVQMAHAGGPLYLWNTGQPWLWANGGQNIPFNPDQGGLGPMDNATAVAQTEAAFATWAAVPSATATFVNAGPLPVDVTLANFYPYYDPVAPDGYSAIVYDEDGSIFDFLFGPNSGILGFSGPEWGWTATGEIFEGVSFLNGGEIDAGFPAESFFDVQVHEFGHIVNMAHSVVNGQIALLGDHSGPTPHDTFPIPSLVDRIETMYPIIFIDGGMGTPHADDIAILSTLYPAPDFFGTTGSIRGTIFASNGTTKLTGVNVIARNVADPFDDAVSAISGDFTDSVSQTDPYTGLYTLNGLTPGADYAVYVDGLLYGGFSTPPLFPLPGPEEFYNGADESSDPDTDDPAVYEAVTVSAGARETGTDIIFNRLTGGVIPLGDDDYYELFLPFTCELCGREFDNVFVNSNGSLTFGSGDTDFSESVADFLDGPPRIAGWWDDLNPSTGGYVWFQQYANKKGVVDEFVVGFEQVPEYYSTGANTFAFRIFLAKLKGAKYGCHIDLIYGDMTATDGLAGVSCGSADTCDLAEEVDLSSYGPSRINLRGEPATYELFSYGENDLANSTVRFNGTTEFKDNWAEPNDVLADAREIHLPFDTFSAQTKYAAIEPAGGDVDYYFFYANGGETLTVEIVGGNLDSLIGLYDFATGTLLDYDDDGGAGLLSKLVYPIAADGEYALAVTTYPDFDFIGEGSSGGRYCLEAYTMLGQILDLGDDDYEEVPIGFAFPYQGASWTSVFVNSNGSLTFGAGDTSWSESVYWFLNRAPRIAALWDDLRPPSGGTVSVTRETDSFSVTFDSVPEFYATGANTFTFTLEPSGRVTIEYGAVSALDGIVGVTEGNGAADPGETDLSAGGPFPAAGTTYELFTYSDPFDLSGATLVFEP